MQTSTSSYKINITHPVYAEVLSDTAEGTTYGPVKEFGEAMEMNITATTASGQLFGNGAVVDSSAMLTGITAAYSATKIPIEVQADIYNHTVTDGVVQVEAGKKAKYIAVGFETEQSEGKSEYTWLLKGRPKPMNQDIKQSESNVNYTTDTLEIDFVKRKSDNMLKYFADLANPEFTEAQAEDWFTQGPATFPKASA